MSKMQRFALSALALAAVVSFAGCDKMKGNDVEAAAKVNDQAISIPQLNRELDKLGKLDPDHAKQAANKVLKSMVEQQVLVQKALSDKLDQDAGVKLALEAARSQVLAQAVVERLTANVAAPTQQEINDYFAKHPELFSERRIYRLQEINVPVTPANAEAVKSQLASTHSLDDFFQWLKEQKIAARVSQVTKPAEQLPTELLPRLAQMRDGQAMTVAAPGALNILVVAGSQSLPVTLEQAKPSIERFITNNKKREVAAAALKDLLAQAKVEYLGAYADAGKEAAPAAPKAEAPATDEAPAAAPASEAK